MKYTNLEMVNKCMEAVNYEPVSDFSTRAGAKVLSIIQDCYYDLMSRDDFPRNKILTTLDAFETTANPTTFNFEVDSVDFVKRLIRVEYNRAGASYLTEPEFVEVDYMEPEDFLRRTNQPATDYVIVTANSTRLKIRDNKSPQYYTTFDQKILYMDSYDADVDSYLLTAKTRAIFEKIPVFSTGTTDVQDLDSHYFNVWLRESQSMCHAILKDGVNNKIEASARINRLGYQDKKEKHEQVRRPNFGRG